MEYNKKAFDDIKYQVQQFIHMNLFNEVTADTKYKTPGIYMIYIDNFSSEKVIPIYIGRANDIQTRYKQHFEEIIALNRLSSEEYKEYFFSKSYSFYEGKFKSSKIFKYMIENKCTLKDFRMVILEFVEKELLIEKEQEYFQKFLPSFFGFNQLSSFLKYFESRVSKTEMNNIETKEFLHLLLEDVRGISTYYEYGFTQFNFKHSLPKGYYLSLKNRYSVVDENISVYQEIGAELTKLEQLHGLDSKRNELKEELERMGEKINSLEEKKETIFNEGKEAVIALRNGLTEKFKEMDMYVNKIPINNFVNSILSDEPQKYKKWFLKFLEGYQCDFDFYQLYEEEIIYIKKLGRDLNETADLQEESRNLRDSKAKENIHKRYQLIFPNTPFEAFSLGDISKNLSIVINDGYELANTCHLNFYISNNGNSRSEVRKTPYIIRIDYCYIDYKGERLDKSYYIDNETTRNAQSGIAYYEKDYYDTWAIKKVPFKLISLIGNEIDNSFISVLAEFKHGINDYTLKNQPLVELSVVLDEIQQMTDEETRFNLQVSESHNVSKMCLLPPRFSSNPFVERLLAKKLLKIKKKKIK